MRIPKFWHFALALGLIFFISRLWGLTHLPVFADEAIYIRWAQITVNEPLKYAFLPLYDGKTPGLMWLLALLLPLFRSDPLWLSRGVTVCLGFGTAWVLWLITQKLGGKKIAGWSSLLLYWLLPFTFLHDRLALTDGLMLFFLSLTFLGMIEVKRTNNWKVAMITGLMFGLAIFSKLTALLFGSQIIFFIWFMPGNIFKRQKWFNLKHTLIILVIGVGMLFPLRISPLFPFLFQRGADFVYSLNEIRFSEGGFGLNSLYKNFQLWASWQLWYATVGLWILIILGIIGFKQLPAKVCKIYLGLMMMALGWSAYFLIAGKVIYSRYYLPTILFMIPLGALIFENFWDRKLKLLFFGIWLGIIIQSIWFMWPWYVNINQVALPREDQQQYLTEWSAGFGNWEAANFIKKRAEIQPIVIGTEGFFGTLPDGISIYFENSNLKHPVTITGYGVPIFGINSELREGAKRGEAYLLVNASRLKTEINDCCQIIARYNRPYGGSDLLLIQVRPL